MGWENVRKRNEMYEAEVGGGMSSVWKFEDMCEEREKCVRKCGGVRKCVRKRVRKV